MWSQQAREKDRGREKRRRSQIKSSLSRSLLWATGLKSTAIPEKVQNAPRTRHLEDGRALSHCPHLLKFGPMGTDYRKLLLQLEKDLCQNGEKLTLRACLQWTCVPMKSATTLRLRSEGAVWAPSAACKNLMLCHSVSLLIWSWELKNNTWTSLSYYKL